MSPRPQQLIALSGPARAGKSTVCHILHRLYGFQVVGFADALKAMSLAVNPVIPMWNAVTMTDEVDRAPVRRLSAIVGDIGWDEAKHRYPEVRRFLQAMGTEGGRECLWPDVWVRRWADTATQHEKVAVPDARFPNEAEAVRALGGSVWRIERPGAGLSGDAAKHISEAGVQYDVLIRNDSTIGMLALQVQELLDPSLKVRA